MESTCYCAFQCGAHPTKCLRPSCPFVHKRVCSFSTGCKKMEDAIHVDSFYHPPRGPCPNGSQCEETNPNHWLVHSHPCFIRGCSNPTIATLNGWLCGYHERLLSSASCAHINRQPRSYSQVVAASVVAASVVPVVPSTSPGH